MLLVRACGAETFVSWTLLERAGVQRHTVLATLRIIYPYEEMWGVWTRYMVSSHCLFLCMCDALSVLLVHVRAKLL